jgi:hypothetical protein
MKLQIGKYSMLKLLREFINQTGFAVWFCPAYKCVYSVVYPSRSLQQKSNLLPNGLAEFLMAKFLFPIFSKIKFPKKGFLENRQEKIVTKIKNRYLKVEFDIF